MKKWQTDSITGISISLSWIMSADSGVLPLVSGHAGCLVYITFRMIRSQSVQIPDTSQIVSMKFLVSLFTILTSPWPSPKSLKVESIKGKRNLASGLSLKSYGPPTPPHPNFPFMRTYASDWHSSPLFLSNSLKLSPIGTTKSHCRPQVKLVTKS